MNAVDKKMDSLAPQGQVSRPFSIRKSESYEVFEK